MVKILIAEDDEIMRITVKDRLEKDSWEVDTVHNGGEAVDCLKKHRYQLVISDIRMPVLDGWGLLGFIRQYSPETDMLLMTSYGSEDDASTALRKGAADYILKPFDMDDLVDKVNRILGLQPEVTS